MVKCFYSFSVLSSLHLYQNMKTLEQGWNTSKKKKESVQVCWIKMLCLLNFGLCNSLDDVGKKYVKDSNNVGLLLNVECSTKG